MKIGGLLKGLEILDKMMVDPRWNISKDGASIIVWDENDDEDEIIQPKSLAELSKSGWIFDENQSGWIIESPVDKE